MPRRNFSFISNSLSKGDYLNGLLQSFSWSGKRNQAKSMSIISEYFEVPEDQVFFYGAGRMSVMGLLKSINVQSDDEVIVAGYTCVVLTNAVKFGGCKVKYVDIRKETLNLDTEKVLSSISDRTRAIIVPHNFGLTYQDIKSIKEKHPNLVIIEDVAHSFGSKDSEGNKCGTLGDASFFSLEYSKPITAGLGGVMIVNNAKLLEGIQNSYANSGVLPKGTAIKILLTLGMLNLTFSQRSDFFQRIGMKALRTLRLNYKTSDKEIAGELPENYPVRMHPLLSNVLIQQLKQLEAINAKKLAIVDNYQNVFGKFKDLHQYEMNDQVLVRYPIVINEKISDETIAAIRKEAASEGILFGDWFNDVIHPKGSYRYCYSEGNCPNGEWMANRMMNLPVNVHQQVSIETLEIIAGIFRKHGLS